MSSVDAAHLSATCVEATAGDSDDGAFEQALQHVSQHARSIKRISLHKCTDHQLAQLAQLLPKCSGLAQLDLSRHGFNDEFLLAQALQVRGRPHDVSASR